MKKSMLDKMSWHDMNTHIRVHKNSIKHQTPFANKELGNEHDWQFAAKRIKTCLKNIKQLMLQKWLHKIKLEICRLDQVKYSKFTKLKVIKTRPKKHSIGHKGHYSYYVSEILIQYYAEGKLYSTGDREIQVAKFPNLITLTNNYFCDSKTLKP